MQERSQRLLLAWRIRPMVGGASEPAPLSYGIATYLGRYWHAAILPPGSMATVKTSVPLSNLAS